MSTLQKVNINLTTILQSANCPITLEPMTAAYSILPCNHKVSKEGMMLLEKKNPMHCPLDRLKITQFVEDKNYSYLVQQAVQLEASIIALNDELSTMSKEEISISKEQGRQSMEHPGPNHFHSKKSIHDQLEIQSPTLADPLPNPMSIDTNNPVQVLKALESQIKKLKTSTAQLTEPRNHKILIEILDFTSKILMGFPSESLFCNLVYKHAYWVTRQKAEIDTEDHNDFGKVSVLDNMLPPEYYNAILYRATIEFYLQYFSRMSGRTLFNYDTHQDYLASTFKEHLCHDRAFSSSFVESLNSYSKESVTNVDLAIRCFLFNCYGKPKGDLKLHEHMLKKLKVVWEKQ